MKGYNYFPQKATVVSRKSLSPETLELTIKLVNKKQIHFTPGQFLLVGLSGFGEVPIGITTAPHQKEISIGIRSAGMVTQKLCSLMVGDDVEINGPFGNGFPISKLKNRDVVIVSAGIGLLPLRSLIQHLKNNKKLVKSLTIFVGARTPDRLLYNDEYSEWSEFASVHTIVDDGEQKWSGRIGNVIDLLGKSAIKRGSVIIACGPPVIYKPIIARLAGKTVADEDIYFLLERKMKCGIGKCQHCTCGKLYVCLDGPVFSYADIKYNPEALK